MMCHTSAVLSRGVGTGIEETTPRRSTAGVWHKSFTLWTATIQGPMLGSLLKIDDWQK